MQGKVFLCDSPAAGWWHAEFGSELPPTDKTDLQHSFVWDTKRRDHLQMLLWRPISAYKVVWSGCLQHPPRPFTTAFCRITWVSVEFISVCEQSARTPVLAYWLPCCTLNRKAISWTHSCKLGDKCPLLSWGRSYTANMTKDILRLWLSLSQAQWLCIRDHRGREAPR